MSRPLRLTLEDRECWRVYESLGRRAALEYAVHPISRTAITSQKRICLGGCGRRTYHQDQRCKTCREGM